jgi:hypothetical protein
MTLKGIAERTFERSFQLDDHVVVKGARLENGLCTWTSYARFRPAPDVVTGGIWECPGFPGWSIPFDLLKREYITIVEPMSLPTVMTGHDRLARL